MTILKCAIVALNFAACTEVSISKTYQPSDTAFPEELITEETDTEITEDTAIQTDLSQVVGYVELGLMQASCPYCLGVSQEINFCSIS